MLLNVFSTHPHLEDETFICLNNFLNLFNLLYPFFKLLEGIMILNTKTKNLVYQILDKKKSRTQNKEQNQVSKDESSRLRKVYIQRVCLFVG